MNLTGSNSTPETHPATTSLEIWGIGLLAVTIINSCAAVGLLLMPILGKATYYKLLTFFIGLGVGSLTGSAVFHLLPETWALNGTETRDYLWKSWTAIAGIYIFFAIDKTFRIIVQYRKKSRQKRICHVRSIAIDQKTFDDIERKISDDTVESSMTILSENARLQTKTEEQKEIAPVAWMVIFGDALHNFVDGLSIGAAFTDGVLSGISICVAVICEEFPHEFGDIAILVSSGMSTRQALGYNLLSACTCYIGFIIGVMVGELSEASVYIFALAAGMFLYIALGNMIPEMNDAMERALSVSISDGFKLLLLQSLGVAVGLLAMFVLAYFDSSIHFA